MLYGNDGWASLDLGDHSEPYVMVDVAVAIVDDTAWFVAREGQFYVYSPNVTTEKELMLPVMSISPMKAADPSDVNAVGEAWGVLGWGGLAISSGDAWVFKTGDTDMISDVAEVSTSVNASALPSRPQASAAARESTAVPSEPMAHRGARTTPIHCDRHFPQAINPGSVNAAGRGSLARTSRMLR